MAFPEIAKSALSVPLERRRDHANIIKRRHWESIRFFTGRHVVFLLSNLFHPINVLTVHGCLNGDMRHPTGCIRAMPVFHTRRYPYDITRFDLLLFATQLLYPACSRCHDQDLTERMG